MSWHLYNQTPDYPAYPDDNYCIDCGTAIPSTDHMCERCKLAEHNGDVRLHEQMEREE